MVRIAPVRLGFNPRTLWFDALDFELGIDDPVVVSTARGLEFGRVSQNVFEADGEETKKLKTPLKPVRRLATEDDVARAAELEEKALAALPVFKRLAAEVTPDMNPVAVEYLFEGDKAVFYFESEERIDFRDLVHRLVSELHVRVDMKQVGIRDGARMVGGLGHCGQELCCRRLGGDFNPVSIRMAKEQDLSLNPQKISGICGRLMCCLRYEYDAYKDFHGRAPKKNAKVKTPDGEGKVVSLDVPREIVSIQVGTEKPVKVPLADMESEEGAARPSIVGQKAWDEANAPAIIGSLEVSSLFTTELTGQDKLADRTAVRRKEEQPSEGAPAKRKRRRRRRSTTVEAGGEKPQQDEKKQQAGAKGATPARSQKQQKAQKAQKQQRGKAHAGQQPASGEAKKKGSQVGRNSSALRASRPAQQAPAKQKPEETKVNVQRRRRRRTHKADTSETQE